MNMHHSDLQNAARLAFETQNEQLLGRILMRTGGNRQLAEQVAQYRAQLTNKR